MEKLLKFKKKIKIQEGGNEIIALSLQLLKVSLKKPNQSFIDMKMNKAYTIQININSDFS